MLGHSFLALPCLSIEGDLLSSSGICLMLPFMFLSSHPPILDTHWPETPSGPLFNYLQTMAMEIPSVTPDFLLEIFTEVVFSSSYN